MYSCRSVPLMNFSEDVRLRSVKPATSPCLLPARRDCTSLLLRCKLYHAQGVEGWLMIKVVVKSGAGTPNCGKELTNVK
jgi:hypothetical protein